MYYSTKTFLISGVIKKAQKDKSFEANLVNQKFFNLDQ